MVSTQFFLRLLHLVIPDSGAILSFKTPQNPLRRARGRVVSSLKMAPWALMRSDPGFVLTPGGLVSRSATRNTSPNPIPPSLRA